VRLYLRSPDRRPDPEPLRTNDRAAIGVGMTVWGVLWIAAVLLHDRLAADGRGWWLWTPPAGIVLGVLGLWYLRAHERDREQHPRP
jgi:hypothetical protein